MKKIVLTGGGTAGHVTPNMALIPTLRQRGYEIHYIGSYDGIEKKLIEEMGVTYHGISTGKLRRYFSLENFTDPFRVIAGFFEAKKIVEYINKRNACCYYWYNIACMYVYRQSLLKVNC